MNTLMWMRFNGTPGRMERWALVDRENRTVLLEIRLSAHASLKENKKIRKRIKKEYEAYFFNTWFSNKACFY